MSPVDRFRPRCRPLELRLTPATFVVDSLTDDQTPDDGRITLREALAAANADTDADVIDLTGVTGTITLTLGELSVTSGVEVRGPGSDKLTVSGNKQSRAFNVYSGHTEPGFGPPRDVTISGLTVRDGVASGTSGHGGGVQLNYDPSFLAGTEPPPPPHFVLRDVAVVGCSASAGGGGVAVMAGTALLDFVRVEGNTSGNHGGGVEVFFGEDPVELRDSVVANNTAAGTGGGVYHNDGASGAGSLTLVRTMVRGNQAASFGGGLTAQNVTLTDSQVLDNGTKSFGGGIQAIGKVAITGSTVSGNTAVQGGAGMSALGTENVVTVTGSTFSKNVTDDTGGGFDAGGQVTLADVVVSGNTAGEGGGGFMIAPNSKLSATRVQVLDNVVDAGFGSAAYLQSGGTAEFVDSLIRGNKHLNLNSFSADGGVAAFDTAVTATRTTVTGNGPSGQGAGFYVASTSFLTPGSLTLNQSTVTGNTSQSGGDVALSGKATLTNNGSEVGDGTGPGIAGVAFQDYDADGVRDADEPALAGVVVYLDANDNRTRDPGEASVTTGADGAFRLPVPGAGTYTVADDTTQLPGRFRGRSHAVTLTSSDGRFTPVALGYDVLPPVPPPPAPAPGQQVTFQFDYRYDTTGFFADPARRAALERAGRDLGGRLRDSLAAITPGGANHWTARTTDPTTGRDVALADLTVPANTLLVFVGSRDLPAPTLGQASAVYPAASATGSGVWRATVVARGQPGVPEAADRPTDTAMWGGSVTFDAPTNWYFGADPAVPDAQLDFYSVALHELTHLIGFTDGNPTFAARTDAAGRFAGPAVVGVAGAAVPLNGDLSHWAGGTASGGRPTLMQPASSGGRDGFTRLDLAALRDIGWEVDVPAADPDPVGGDDHGGPDDGGPPKGKATPPRGPLLVGGADDGTVLVVAPGGGTLQPGDRLTFPGLSGPVRTAVADVNGDGTPDFVGGSGPGGPARVVVLDGNSRAVLASFLPYGEGYTGGVWVAAADFTGDGKAEAVVAPDLPGVGPQVRVYAGDGLTGGTDAPAVLAAFRGLASLSGEADTSFLGGARVAAADVTGDGVPDLVVGAGNTGGPRVTVWPGQGFAGANGGQPTANPAANLFVFESTQRDGAFVAGGDASADGFADLAFGGGPGGGPRVRVVDGRRLLALPDLEAVNLDDPANLASGLIRNNFFAGDPESRGGVRVAFRDADGDPRADLVTVSGDGQPTAVRLYSGAALAAVPEGTPAQAQDPLDPFGASLVGGVFVG